jgi:hypothetical protein
MDRKTAFNAYLSTGKAADQPAIQAIRGAPGPVREYFEGAPPEALSQLAATDAATLEGLRAAVVAHANAKGLLPGSPPPEVLGFLAAQHGVREFLRNIPARPPHLVSARAKIDDSHSAVSSWFDDWKAHSTGILNVHKGILDGSLAPGGAMFAALAQETIGLYATAFHWMLRPYVKK